MSPRYSNRAGPEKGEAMGAPVLLRGARNGTRGEFCPGDGGKRGEDLECPLWDEAAVKTRLREAAETLRAMTLSCRDRPARIGSGWPDVVRQSCEAYGYSEVRVRPPAPPPTRISRADEAVTWLLWLTDAERRVSWARASGITWRRLEDIDGRSHVTLRKIQSSALQCICEHLNAAGRSEKRREWGRITHRQKTYKYPLTEFIN